MNIMIATIVKMKSRSSECIGVAYAGMFWNRNAEKQSFLGDDVTEHSSAKPCGFAESRRNSFLPFVLRK